MTSRTKHSRSGEYTAIIILLAVYFSQSALGMSGILAQGVLGLIILYGFFSWLSTFFMSRRTAFLNVMSLFYLLVAMVWTVSEKSVVSPELGWISTSVMFKNVTMFCLMLFAGYRIGRLSDIPFRQEREMALIVVATALLQYVIVGHGADGLSGRFTNNGAYCLISALPYVVIMMRGNKSIPFICFLLIAVCIGASGKRGAMVCLLAAASYYFFLYPGNSSSRKGGRLLSAAVLLLTTMIALFVELAQNPYLYERMALTWEGYSSGRDFLYYRCVRAWLNEPDELLMIFGRGLSQTITIAGNYAHCDWLELLTDTGLPGVALYLLFFAAYIRFIRRNRRLIPADRRFIMNLIILLLFIESVFSMGFMAIFNCFDTLLLGLLAARTQRRKHSDTSCVRFSQDRQ